jgi:hypothetical protein
MMVTPTFFAGACIVFAATLAYGTTQTHLVFSGGQDGTCGAANCSASGPAAGPGKSGGAPYQESATPATGVARGTATGGATDHAPAGGGPAGGGHAAAGPRTQMTAGPGGQVTAAGPATGGSPANTQRRAYSSGLPVIITYRTVTSWDGGFVVTMTITNRSKSAIPNWLLWLHYRHARIDRVWGARWYPAVPRAPGAGLVAPRVGQLMLWPGASVRFTFRASGRAAPLPGCFFDTARCSFR